jgi:hypothetical protein
MTDATKSQLRYAARARRRSKARHERAQELYGTPTSKDRRVGALFGGLHNMENGQAAKERSKYLDRKLSIDWTKVFSK